MVNRILSSAAIGLLLVACAEPPPPEAPPQPPTVAPAPSPALPPEPAQASVPVAPAPAPAPPAIKIVALKLVGQKKAAGRSHEIKADGTILVDKKPFGKIVGSEIQNVDGKVLVSLGTDGKVLGGDAAKPARFNANDEIEFEGGKLSVGNDGVITLTQQDGKAEIAPFKFEGLTPEGKRTAALFSVVLMFSSSGDLTVSPASVSVAASVAKAPAPGKGSQGKSDAPKPLKKP